MKQIKHLACAVLCAAAFFLSGCSNQADAAASQQAVCYVLANTANSQGLNLASPLVEGTIYDVVRNYGYISVVNVDAAPEVVFAQSFALDEQYKNASAAKLDMTARNNTTGLVAGMQGIVADDPETDFLAALRLASRSLSSLQGYQSKSIVVVGTGLSTAGVMDFNNNLLSATPEEVVALLAEQEEIPNFEGITVYFQQLGDTATPQQPLSSAQRNDLQQMYRLLVEAGGGTFVANDMVAAPINEAATYPSVSPVELPPAAPVQFDAAQPLADPIVFTAQEIPFTPDSAAYLQPGAASQVLQPVATSLKAGTSTVLLCGTTAGDADTSFSLQLSQARAQTVKDSLVAFGVSDAQIVTVGLGATGDPWHVYGLPEGSDRSAVNRKVILLDASSALAQDILAKAQV